MSKIFALLGVVGVFLIVGLYVRHTAEAPVVSVGTEYDEQVAEEQSDMAASGFSGRGSLADFFANDEPVTCTFSGTYDDGAIGDGELWYANEQLRVESVMRVDGEVYTANLIDDGTSVFMWSGTAAGMQAMKMSSTETDTFDYERTAMGQANSPIGMDQEVTYECQTWIPNTMQFVPPSDLEFVDMEAVMQGMFEGELRGAPEGLNF